MTTKALVAIPVALVMVGATPTTLDAQTWQEVRVADIETMRDKFTGLA